MQRNTNRSERLRSDFSHLKQYAIQEGDVQQTALSKAVQRIQLSALTECVGNVQVVWELPQSGKSVSKRVSLQEELEVELNMEVWI